MDHQSLLEARRRIKERMSNKNQLRKLAGIDTRSQEERNKDDLRMKLNKLNIDIREIAKAEYLWHTFDCRNKEFIEIVKIEYSDCKITEANGRVTINWAEPEDIEKIKFRIEQLEKDLLVQTERRDLIRKQSADRPVWLGPIEELSFVDQQIHKLSSKIKFLKATFIED